MQKRSKNIVLKHLIILIQVLLMSSCVAQNKKIPENVLEVDNFGDSYIVFSRNSSTLSTKSKQNLDCYIDKLKENGFITKEIVFIVHNYFKDKEDVKSYLDAKNNILNYLSRKEESIINMPHRFYYGAEKNQDLDNWFFEVQIIFEYEDKEGVFKFTNCNN